MRLSFLLHDSRGVVTWKRGEVTVLYKQITTWSLYRAFLHRVRHKLISCMGNSHIYYYIFRAHLLPCGLKNVSDPYFSIQYMSVHYCVSLHALMQVCWRCSK